MKELWFSITKKDLEVQTFRAGGPGGQGQNTTDSGVRIVHKESGARGEARDSRSQHKNKREALKRMTEDPKFKFWLQQLKSGHDPAMYQITDDNVLVEYKQDGKWVAQ